MTPGEKPREAAAAHSDALEPVRQSTTESNLTLCISAKIYLFLPLKKRRNADAKLFSKCSKLFSFSLKRDFCKSFLDHGFYLYIDQDTEMSSPFMKSLNYRRKSLWLLLSLVEKIIILNIKNTSTKKSGDAVMFLAVCFHRNFLRKFWTDGIGDLTGDCKLLSGNFIWRFLNIPNAFSVPGCNGLEIKSVLQRRTFLSKICGKGM